MKKAEAILMFGTVLLLVECGGTSGSSGNINGNWTAALSNAGAGGSAALAFNVTLQQSGGSTLSVTNLHFTTTSPCFGPSAIATGGFTLSGTLNGVTSGGFQMTVQSASGGGGNDLTLQGTVQNNTITGSWTLTGVTSGCTGSGSFTMSKG